MHVRDFAPPILAKLYARVRGTRGETTRIYSSFQEALRDCGKGYEADELAGVILAKTVVFKERLEAASAATLSATEAFGILSVAHVLTHLEGAPGEIRVIDLGGACGAHYFAFKKFFGSRVRFKWTVVETPTMCRYADRIKNEELSFSDNLGDALLRGGTPTLVHVSGVLQFLEHPYAMLDKVVKSRAPYLFFNRMALTAKAEDLITVHRSKLSSNGIGPLPAGIEDKDVRYPYVVLAQSKFESFLGAYEKVVEFDEQSGISPVNNEPVHGGGVLLRLKREP
jgi:putative methyltransferase (TIGR04325 family)